MSFASQISNALKSIRKTAGVVVTYSRGDQSITVNAVPGETNFGADVNDMVVLEYRTRDFMFATSDLYFGTTPIIPMRGDQIKEDNGTYYFIYEISKPDGADQCYRFSDYGRSQIRVHSKLKETIAK